MKGAPSTSRWWTSFAASPAQRVAIFIDDRVSFLEALCTAWSLDKQVVLPGDVLSNTLTALEPHVDAWAGDIPGRATLPPGDAVPLEVKVDREHLGLVVFTSGSSGAPTVIPKKLRQVFDEVATLEATFGPRLGSDCAIVGTVSHQHIYGLLFAVLWPLVTGRRVTSRRIEYPEELEPVISERPCVLISSPAHLKRLPDERRWHTKLDAIFSSGGPLPPEGAQMAQHVLGHQPIEVYGSSETGGIAWRQGSAAAWSVLRGVTVGATDEGTLRVQSPHLLDAGDWFVTADRVALEGDSFRLLGRADRIAKIEEKRVSLDLIERTAVQTGLLSAARVVALEGGHRTTLGLAGVPSARGAALARKELVDSLRAAIGEAVERVAIPRRFRFVESLPVDDQGKLTTPRLLMLFALDRPIADWTERTATHAALTMTITPDLKVLDGHFPGTPIVPGVAQLDWAISFGRDQFPMPPKLARLEILKFQKLMLPGHVVELVLDWNETKHALTFKFFAGENNYSSGKVVFTA